MGSNISGIFIRLGAKSARDRQEKVRVVLMVSLFIVAGIAATNLLRTSEIQKPESPSEGYQ